LPRRRRTRIEGAICICGRTCRSCTVPCKEQVRNRQRKPAAISCSRRLVVHATQLRPHAEEHRSVTERRRCPSPKRAAMRLEAHECAGSRSSPSFETRAHAFEFAAPPSACALLKMRTSIACGILHHFKQPISFPRPHCCVRALPLCFTHPPLRVGGAPRDVRVLGGTPVGRARNAARQAPSEAPCVP
jgi:hypothetical protein